jgi:tetratricopeptide (TPR) repeat protein
MTFLRNRTTLALLVALSLLAACESSKDKAARHLASAVELISEGDFDRALVEFRNVFQLDPDNRDARMAFGSFLQDRGNLPEAYAQYQNVIDRAPQDLPALMAGAKAAALLDRWAEAGKLADQALALSAEDPGMLAIKAGFDYATALSAADAPGRRAAAETARTLLAAQPGNLLLHRVVTDNLMQDGDFPAAIVAIDAALATFPDEKVLYLTRLSALAAQNDDAAVVADLQKMVARFPQDLSIAATLLRWYISKDQLDQAEAFLRGRAKDGDLTAGLDLVNFLRQYRSLDAALAEIDAVLASMPPDAAADAAAEAAPAPADPAAADAAAQITPALMRTLRASLLFEQGKRDEAIKEMQDILATAPATDQTRQFRVMLAQMMFTTGDAVQARALVEAVLADDPGQAGALKLKAAWLVDGDKTDDAVALLRRALDANPKDAEAYTLLAQAYERAGSRELAGDMLSQAVIASGKAPAESLRYATFLTADAKYLPAEGLLVDALRLDPENVAILANLGRLYVLMKDWPRATGVVDRLDELATPETLQISQTLRPAVLAGSAKVDEAISYLQGLAAGEDAGLTAQVTLIQAYLANGQPDKARLLAEDLLKKSPDDPQIRFIAAAIKGATGDSAGAQAAYRDLLAEDPKRETVWTALMRQMMQDGKPAEAEAVVDEALKVLPDSGNLQVAKAGFLEQRQDPEGAIAIYQKLYDLNSSNQIIANNLASMLASYRSDPESLEQAFVVARRLRGTTVPAFADTYGWILHNRGNAAEALPYLETAAAGLPQDPMVQYHLAEVLTALARTEDARAQYAKVLALVPAEDARAFVLAARKAVAGP